MHICHCSSPTLSPIMKNTYQTPPRSLYMHCKNTVILDSNRQHFITPQPFSTLLQQLLFTKLKAFQKSMKQAKIPWPLRFLPCNTVCRVKIWCWQFMKPFCSSTCRWFSSRYFLNLEFSIKQTTLHYKRLKRYASIVRYQGQEGVTSRSALKLAEWHSILSVGWGAVGLALCIAI